MDGTATERPLHPTQYGNHLEYKSKPRNVRQMNPEVKKLIEKGYNYRTAYRMVNLKKKQFDYEANTPKGEWI